MIEPGWYWRIYHDRYCCYRVKRNDSNDLVIEFWDSQHSALRHSGFNSNDPSKLQQFKDVTVPITLKHLLIRPNYHLPKAYLKDILMDIIKRVEKNNNVSLNG